MTIVRSPSEVLGVLVVDDQQPTCRSLSQCLQADGHRVTCVASFPDALAAAAASAFDLILVSIHPGNESGLEFISLLLAQNPWVKIAVINDHASVDTAVEAMKRGAIDYLPSPYTSVQVEQLASKVARQRQLELKSEAIQQAIGDRDVEADFQSSDPAFRAAVELAQRVAPTTAAVLIQGEIGTGRQRLAHAMHIWSLRSAAPFVVVACHGDTESLDAELFGTTTNLPSLDSQADSQQQAIQRAGRVELAAGGTLFLKEITNTPICLQPKLVRLLRDHEFERHGEFLSSPTNVRVIASTSKDLQESVHAGTLRPDLAQALDIVKIDLPTLRERRADIPSLAQRYLAHFAHVHSRSIVQFSDDSMNAIKQHSYPGNSIELANVIERAVLLSRGSQIMLEDLPAEMVNVQTAHTSDGPPAEPITDAQIREVLASNRSRESIAALLGMNFLRHWRRRKRLAT